MCPACCFVPVFGAAPDDPPTNLRQLPWVWRVASYIPSDVSFPPFSYYTKRAQGARGDPRLAVLPHHLFKERRVLDIGCNEGVVTIEIGAFLLSANSLSSQKLRADPLAHIYNY